MKLMIVSSLAAMIFLSGCATTSVVAESDHVDFTYRPILLKDESSQQLETGQEEFRDFRDGWPAVVLKQCTQGSKDAFGGSLVPIIGGWLSKLFVDSLSKAVDKRIAEYSSVRTTQQFAGNFYDPKFWRTYSERNKDRGHSLCFEVRQVTCPKAALAHGDTSCPANTSARLSMVGQFLREGEVLRVRPLSLQLKGIATRYKEGEGSFAARIQGKAVWQDDGIGKSQDFFDAPLLVIKFTPTASLAEVEVKVPEWDDTPILPRLPESENGGRGMALITVSVAEAAKVPASLSAFQSFLGAKGDDLAGVLKDAIEGAID